jgi:hypothetical protein
VSHMAMCHQKVPISHPGLFLNRSRTMDGNVLPEGVSVANAQPRRFAAIFYILRLVPNHATGVKTVVSTDRGMTSDMNVGSNDTRFIDLDIAIDDRVRTYRNIWTELRARINDCSGMNSRHHNEKYPSSRNET